MNSVDVLKRASELAFSELLTALDGVTEAQAWAVLPQGGADYLHSDGSVHSITLHVAVCKLMYGSVGFRGTEIRWRDCATQVEGFEPSWTSALEYLNESHRYWLASWEALGDHDLERESPHFRGKTWPAWKIIHTMIHHDSYHAGQIAVLRYASSETNVRPRSEAADLRECCAELPSW